ncbi:hypothetical protein PAE9249_05172 [Paenibacillus sp. CECT 9249]|uniref:FRG domain-containing protein n=1 Tax=Paenibacillus sp. CECT 9249 TaxID=2845385 RepID=UPI001E41A920|nr:FRG domain-containing protein [Paenibacillus sp. CECT 9249]CAH0122600.1 hypothetical protein PAE9249_05172 [Paenibacillus sp. CECT 9249]
MRWNEVLQTVKEFKKDNNSVWFRGQPNDAYQLKSSLFRQNIKKVEQVLLNERARYNLFKNNGHLYHNLDDWDLLYLMQHHGVKTRLLDWTESFATALYFASNHWQQDNPISIWMLNPNKLNKKSINDGRYFVTHGDSYKDRLYQINDKKFFENSVALHPVKTNHRIVAQQGVFTIQGNTLLPLDEEFDGALITEGILKKVTLTKELSEDVAEFLYFSGITPFTIFPDLKGLAEYVNLCTENNS